MRRVSERTVLHVLPHPGGGGQRYIDTIAQMEGYQFEQVDLTHERGWLEAARGARALRRREPSWDLVHIHGETAAILCSSLLRERPGVFNYHGLHLSRRTHGIRGRIVRNRLRRATALARAGIASERSERAEAAVMVGPELASKLVTIPSGVPIPPLPEPARRLQVREELGVPAAAIMALFTAQLEPRKGPLDFIEGVARARDRDPRIEGVMLGGGPLEREVGEAAPRAGVRWLGERPDFERFLEASDIFVMPSAREGHSLAVIGAMAAGVAVVVADGPGNPETVEDTGVVFPFGDAETLAVELVRLAADQGERARLGAAARERASDLYSAERMAAGMKELYDRVLAEAGTRG